LKVGTIGCEEPRETVFIGLVSREAATDRRGDARRNGACRASGSCERYVIRRWDITCSSMPTTLAYVTRGIESTPHRRA
jgi:hypothetical protein